MSARQQAKAAPLPSAAMARRNHPRSVPIMSAENEDATAPEQPFGEGIGDVVDPDLRHRMISETAYHLYEERGYADGYDVDDWLQAEAAVDHLLIGAARGTEPGSGT
jgi:predicted acyl esterase